MVTLSFSIPLDAEGYLARECPACGAYFKLRGDDAQDREVLVIFCPECGLAAPPSHFFTREQIEVSKAVAIGWMTKQLNETFGKMEREFRSSKYISFKSQPLQAPPVRKLREIVDLSQAELPCCETSVKVSFLNAISVLYCPFCGSVQV